MQTCSLSVCRNALLFYRQIATAYVGATSGAVFASVGLNSLLAVRNNTSFAVE